MTSSRESTRHACGTPTSEACVKDRDRDRVRVRVRDRVRVRVSVRVRVRVRARLAESPPISPRHLP